MSKKYSYLNENNDYLLNIPSGSSEILPANNYDLEMTYIVGNDNRELSGIAKIDFVDSSPRDSNMLSNLKTTFFKLFYWTILLCLALYIFKKINH